MDSEDNQQTLDIVREVWADDCDMLGEDMVARIARNPDGFTKPSTGDPLDLGALIETVKSAIELVAACVTLYAAVRDARKPKADAEEEVKARIDTAKGEGSLTPDQATSLLKLITDRG